MDTLVTAILVLLLILLIYAVIIITPTVLYVLFTVIVNFLDIFKK